MDISRAPQKKPLLKRYWPAFAGAGAIASVLLITQSFGNASYVADADGIVLGEVRHGDFAVQVRGVGTLVPKNIQWLAANVEGVVDNIAVEAGATVKQGDVIATLANLQLKEQLQESQWEIEATTKENRAAAMTLESELAEVRAIANTAELDYRSAALKVKAETTLVEKGIVSRLTFEQSKLAAEQFQQAARYQQARLDKMEANLAATIEAHAARINKMRNSHNLIQQKIDDLSVRAPIDGVVQEMVLKLGQRVMPGAEAARIAPHDNLVAMLDVQDFQVRDVVPGQTVTIDTRASKIAGKVVRIDPAVVNGVVKVEVALEGQIPADARPDLSVEGIIEVERKADALFVNRPTFAQSHSKIALYRVDDGGGSARRVNVELGRASTRQIEIVSGLKEGDRIIVSDSSAWESHDQILLR